MKHRCIERCHVKKNHIFRVRSSHISVEMTSGTRTHVSVCLHLFFPFRYAVFDFRLFCLTFQCDFHLHVFVSALICVDVSLTIPWCKPSPEKKPPAAILMNKSTSVHLK